MEAWEYPTAALLTKRIYARGMRHTDEVYGGVADLTPGSQAMAYLRVDGTRESLIYKKDREATETVLTAESYVLSPHFVDGYLFWVERMAAGWGMRGIKTDTPPPASVVAPIPTKGRPRALASWRGREGQPSLLVWEERLGKTTRVRLVRIEDSEISTPVDITDGTFNAYDPACCVTHDGSIAVAYSTFLAGQYRILLQRLDGDGHLLGELVRLSNHADACVYPSVWPRRSGGLWFSYTCFDAEPSQDRAFVEHLRFRAQRRFFKTRGTVYAGVLGYGPDGPRTFGVHAPVIPGQKQGPTAAMIVHGSTGAGHSHVFEDPEGRLRLLLRQHSEADPPRFAEADAPFRVSGVDVEEMAKAGHPRMAPRNNHPAISLMTLLGPQAEADGDSTWSKPLQLIPRAHVEAPISFGLDGHSLRVGFTEDGRHTGWSTQGEWFDEAGELTVGRMELALKALGEVDYELRPYVIAPRPGASVEDPELPNAGDGPYIHAMGQTHAHTNLSVCIREGDRDAHLSYRWMQDVQHSDFGATTDHAYNMWHTEMLLTRKFAEYYYFPGTFVAIPAYEWTGSIAAVCGHEGGPWGHVNPLYLEEEGDLAFYTPCDPECAGGSLQRLWETYAGRRIVTPPHHVVDALHPYNWEFFNPDFEPVIEIFQDQRGSGEQPWAPGVTNNLHQEEGHWALPQLLDGRRFGFIASSDHTGLARAGLLVTELTRSALYEAFMARRTFGTTAL
ncbi:MAG: hypothetical protein ACP5JG_04975, partial [Anaerolineae bacterium]